MKKYVLFFVLAFSSLIAIAGPTRHIVLDIDGTLVDSVDDLPRDPARDIEIEGKFYRISEGAEAAVTKLLQQPDVQISFFSGGTASRNRALLERLKLNDRSGRSFRDVAHVVLSKSDISDIYPGQPVPEGMKENQRYRKDLTKISGDLENIILVDDWADFVPDSQMSNVLHVGEAYTPLDNFAEAAALAKAGYKGKLPPDYNEWARHKNKIFRVFQILQESLVESRQSDGKSFRALVAEKSRRPAHQASRRGIVSLKRSCAQVIAP